MEKGLAGRATRGNQAVKFISQFEPDAVAYQTAKTCIEFLQNNKTLQAVAIALASRLEGEINYSSLKTQDPAAYKKLMKVLKSHTGLGTEHRHVVVKKQMKWAGISQIRWDKKTKLKVGTILVKMMCEVTGLVALSTRRTSKNKTPTILISTEATRLWLEQSHKRCELLQPFSMPMLIEPRPWDAPYGGGYLLKDSHYPLIKTANKAYLTELADVTMPLVYNGINALQRTGWKVNTPIHNVLSKAWRAGGCIGKLPSTEDQPLPALDYDPKDPKNEARHKSWKRKASRIHEHNFRARSKRLQLVSKLWVAEKFMHEEEFFFPYALDWRGRAYPVSIGLNPQGDDAAKSLLKFSEGKALGINGEYWLAIHGANCYGIDNVSFADRAEWVVDNYDNICQAAIFPMDSDFWQDADKPYQFLAFCFEWNAMHMMAKKEDFISHLPIAFDGTCNGLQNFSAMLRDEIGGKSVGLMPTDTPPDVYTDVLNEAERLISEEDSAMATKWAGKLTRALCKSNTMTMPYGVTPYGMKDQIVEAFTKMRDNGHDFGFEPTLDDAAYLATINYVAISNTVVAARAAMDWLKASAIIASGDGLPISWLTPSGLPVLQSYRQVFGKRHDFDVEGRRYQMILKVEGEKLDKRRQTNGIAPNYIHSLDASHLMLTINYCTEVGITSFAMIHDSYGTHACDADTLSTMLRKAFHTQYSTDVLSEFREQLLAKLPESLQVKVKPLPPKGTLNLDLVLQSEYFFA